MGESKSRREGYKCPVRGCAWPARLFNSPLATAQHIQSMHGREELVKRLRVGEKLRRLQHQVAGQPGGRVKRPTPPPIRCAASRDGDCCHAQCPQLRDGEPAKTGQHCPLDLDDDLEA